MVELENGQFAFLPNNYLLYKDSHFISKNARENLKYYKRGDKVYWGK
jgi:hypothetical protein